MRRVDGITKSVRELLEGKKYVIDYYQREYKWQTKQVQELLDDLASSFLDEYQPGHELRKVKEYGHYYLGSIILSDKGNESYIVDGQQRLTTLTLLLIYLRHQRDAVPRMPSLDKMIYSDSYGEQSFNIEVDERRECMKALFDGEPFDGTDQPESVRNMVGRYEDISNQFPDELKGEALPYFTYWLVDNVDAVEITAFSDEDAYLIFETMNDRGLSLTPLDMLKGYLLAKISDPKERVTASNTWQSRIEQLSKLGKEEDSDAFKAWLRGRHADSIRERKRGATPGDFDRIGTEFHRWIREKEGHLKLRASGDFFSFIRRDMAFYTGQYQRLREASSNLKPGLEHVYYNAQLSFTLQYPFLLAPLVPDEADEAVLRKIRVAAQFLEIMLVRRLWNYHSIDYNTMQYRMFLRIKEVRGKPLPELAAHLRKELEKDSETFDAQDRFQLNMRNRYFIHRILARITDHIERQSGLPSRYAEYVAEGPNKYEVEHVWADKYERHADEFDHPQDFAEYRNRIGDLLLLPKRFNASFGSLPYEEKLEHYNSQNLLARSLHPAAYDHNPGFRQFVERSGLPFKAHKHFKRADVDERQALYTRLAEEIWNPALLTGEVGR